MRSGKAASQRVGILAFVFWLTLLSTSAMAAAQTAVTQASGQATTATQSQPTPGPSLDLCRYDPSVAGPSLEAIREKFLALCLQHQISMMDLQAEAYSRSLDYYKAKVPPAIDRTTISNRLLADQSWENRLILAVVILIVLCGLGLAIAQFVDGWRSARKRRETIGDLSKSVATPGDARSGADPAKDALVNIVKFGNVEIQSNVLGVAILAVSLAFFLLYLQFVYTIKVI